MKGVRLHLNTFEDESLRSDYRGTILARGRSVQRKESAMNDQLKRAIESTVKQFRDDPKSFLSERDIQAVLFVELRKEMSSLWNHYLPGGKNLLFGCNEPFCIRPITTEYYLYNGKTDRFDVAVLSNEPDPHSALWRQPCRIAIEIKLWQPGYGEPGCRLDVEKLKRYQSYLQKKFLQIPMFTGIAMLFVHPWVKQMPKDISEEISPDAYPENGVALHLVTVEGHWWKQFPGPSITE
jgi:hypothetical protein